MDELFHPKKPTIQREHAPCAPDLRALMRLPGTVVPEGDDRLRHRTIHHEDVVIPNTNDYERAGLSSSNPVGSDAMVCVWGLVRALDSCGCFLMRVRVVVVSRWCARRKKKACALLQVHPLNHSGKLTQRELRSSATGFEPVRENRSGFLTKCKMRRRRFRA